MQTTIKVRGYHLDVYRHVNNARYLEFLEEARWEWLEKGEIFQWLQTNQLAFVIVNININYRCPAELGDELRVDSELVKSGGRSGVLSQNVIRTQDEQLVADALVTFVCVDVRTQKAAPMTEELRSRLSRLMSSQAAV